MKYIFLIGAQKAATTSLFDLLRGLSVVKTHDVLKDQPYFVDETRTNRLKALVQNLCETASEDDFLLVGWVHYVFFPQQLLRGLEREGVDKNDVMFLYVNRPSLDRAVSAYEYNRSRGLQSNCGFEQAFETSLHSSSPAARYGQDIGHFLDDIEREYYWASNSKPLLEEFRRVFEGSLIVVIDYRELITNGYDFDNLFSTLQLQVNGKGLSLPKSNKGRRQIFPLIGLYRLVTPYLSFFKSSPWAPKIGFAVRRVIRKISTSENGVSSTRNWMARNESAVAHLENISGLRRE